MRILFVLITLLFTSNKRTNLDLGLPEIEAVCKVTLKDGKTIEGFITFGFGGFEYKYRPNGFCFINEKGVRSFKFYNFKFQFLDVEKQMKNQRWKTKLYYVNNISTRDFSKRTESFNKKDRTLTITDTDVEKYQFLDEMTLYTKLPFDLFVGNDKGNLNGTITIPVSEIQSVELLKKPSTTSIETIKKAREKLYKDQEKEEWVDYYEPVWYHEIITDKKELLTYLNF